MADTSVEEGPGGDLAGLRRRAAEGDTRSAEFLAEIEAADATRAEKAREKDALEAQDAELDRIQKETFKKRKFKTGVSLITGGQDFVFEDSVSAVINYVQEHGADVVSIDFAVRNSTHEALVQYTSPTEIAAAVAIKLRSVQQAVKVGHQKSLNPLSK